MTGRIVVGVDGSEHSRRALQYALEEAHRRGLDLEVVHAYQLPLYWAQMEFGGPMPNADRDQAEREAMAVIDRLLPRPHADVHVDRTTVYGPPAASLLQAAQGTDLLVVGTRGLGGFKGLLLGSTSHQVITHAPCPVVVVPGAPSAVSDADAA